MTDPETTPKIEQPRTQLGTASIWLSLIPVLALSAWFAINPPCGTLLRTILEELVIWGTVIAFPISIFAVFKDKPKKRAIIGLSLSSLIVIAFITLVGAIIHAVTTGSHGSRGTMEVFYSNATGSTPLEPGLFITTDTKYYDICGSTEDELHAQMNTLGPHGFSAFTDSPVTYRYFFRENDGRCSIERARVDVAITVTYPRWKDPGTDPLLTASWNGIFASLENHEKEHEEIAKKAGQEILDTLQIPTSYQSCTELKQSANALADGILGKMKQSNLEFDRVTDHGRFSIAQRP